MGLTSLMSLQSIARYIIGTLTELYRCCTFQHLSRLSCNVLLLSLTWLNAVECCSILLPVI